MMAFIPVYAQDLTWKELATEIADSFNEEAAELQQGISSSTGLKMKLTSDFTSSDNALNIRLGFYDTGIVNSFGPSEMNDLKQSFVGGMLGEWANTPELSNEIINIMQKGNGKIKLTLYEIGNKNVQKSVSVTPTELKTMFRNY